MTLNESVDYYNWYQIEGFRPEWYISTIYHCRDIPFWLETLEMVEYSSDDQYTTPERNQFIMSCLKKISSRTSEHIPMLMFSVCAYKHTC